MTKAQPDLDAPWWEQFPERLAEESLRFATAFPEPFVLRCDPRQPNLSTPAEEQKCFIWRGVVRVRVRGTSARNVKGSGADRFVVDFIYPETYPFERIKVEFVEPRIKRARHLVTPSRPCYLSYNPNGWTPTTTNAQVYDLIKNWLVGHLSGWALGRSINVPEHAIFLGGGLAALQIILPPELYEGNARWLGEGELLLRGRQRKDGSRVVVVQTLRDYLWKSEVHNETLEPWTPLLLGNGEDWIHRAVWFDVQGEVGPIRSIEDLLQLYERQGPPAKRSNSRAEFEQLLFAYSRSGLAFIFVRFRPTPGQLMWMGFVLFVDKSRVILPRLRNNKRPLKLLDQRKRLRVRRGVLGALALHPLRQRDLFRRLAGVYPAEEFHTKKVAVIGCGAVGAPATVLLAKAGIGHFILCDGDAFSVTNVVRHELDLRFVGRNKAQGLGEHLEAINPFVKVQAIPRSLTTVASIREAIRDTDVVLVAIADKAIEALISRVALREGKTVFYGRGHAQMSVARVARITPGEDACALCLDRYVQGEGDKKSDSYMWVEETGQWLFDDGCGSAAVPGAAVDRQLIGNLLARRAIEFLQGDRNEKNHWVQVARAQPNSLDWRLWKEGILHAQRFKPLDNCPECAFYCDEKKVRDESIAPSASASPETPPFDAIEIAPEVHRLIVDECASCGRLETGGVMAGFVDAPRRTLVVTHATDAGPEATHRRHFFQRDRAYCQAEIERICQETRGKSDYVGEWHKHTSTDTRPSSTDKETLVNIATRDNYALSQGAMIICGMPHANRFQKHSLRGLSFRRGEEGVRELEVQVVSGAVKASPDRGS